MSAALTRLFGFIDAEGSTRPAALLRIMLAVIVIMRFGIKMMFREVASFEHLAILVVFWLSALAMLFGLWSQLATGVVAALMGYCVWRLGRLDGSWRHHHVGLMNAAIACLAFTPCGRSYSLDRWRALARGDAPPERGPLWALRLIAVQLTAVYLWGSLDKCTPAWFSGSKFESQLLFFIFDSDPPAIPGWRLIVQISALATLAFEFVLTFGLWFRRARRILIPLGILFHVAIYVTLPVTVFSALSVVLYLAYVDADALHAAIDRMQAPAAQRVQVE